MSIYSQTLDGIPKEFLLNQKKPSSDTPRDSTSPNKTEDLLFILAVLLFLQDEPFIAETD